ncbi:hypothetical protein C8R44DRAFT_856589 [Mycena epipterygia]|nr:hypothetical protein C8R44DRAFT_856589 [Mycena epipterygia]
MKELCADTVDTIRVLRDQIATHGDTAALKLKTQCEELEGFLQDAVEAVNQLQMRPRGLAARIKQAVKSSRTTNEMNRFQSRIREARSNFMLLATLDTNFQVQKVLNMISPNLMVSQVLQHINNCPRHSRIFHGRQTILDQMHQYFTENGGKQDIFVLHGLGGAGKTQIALKFIAESASHFTDIFFIDSSSIDTIETSLKNIAKIKSIGDSSQDALQWLRSKQEKWLLFFDNADDPKVLQYLPLAIIQAGAFISKSGALNSYLALYEHNRARLLSERPAQLHDDYAWTVYTTWQMSFQQLSPQAAMFLQLCSLIHHQGISEQIFKNAVNYRFGASSPSKEELERPIEFLSQFLGPDGVWDSLCFMDVTNEIRTFSLINFAPEQNQFSIHPLVHDWTRRKPEKAEELQIEVLKKWKDVLGKDHPDTLEAMYWMVRIYTDLGKFEEAEQLGVRTVKQRRHILGDNDPRTLDAMGRLGMILIKRSKFKEAEELNVLVLEKRRNIAGDNHPDTLTAMGELAFTCNQLGKYKEAESIEVLVLEKRRDILGDNHPDTLRAMDNLASTYHNLGKFKESEELGIAVVEKERNLLGDHHPHTLIAMGNLAETYKRQKKFQEAEELEVVVLERRRAVLHDNHPDTLTAMANLAVTYGKLGRWQQAEELLVMVLEKRRNILGDNHQSTLNAMANLAVTYNRAGRWPQAEELLVMALQKQRNILGENHPSTLRTMGDLAVTYNGLERWLEAEELGISALKKLIDALGDNHSWTLETMQNLAVTYAKLGKLKEAGDLNKILNSDPA